MIYPDQSAEKGISKYSLDLIKNIRKQGFKKIDGVTFIQGKPITLFKKMLNLNKYDIIHIQHEYNLLGWYGISYFILFFYLSFFKKTKLVITMHSVLSQREKFIGSRIKTIFRKIFYKIQNWYIKKIFNKIIIHSESFKEILINEYGFKEEKIKVFPHAIIENIKTLSKTKSRKELKISGKVYLLIGTMNIDHGHHVIIRQADKIGKTILVATNPSVINYRNIKKIKDNLKFNQEIVKKNNFEKFVRFDIGEIPYDKWWKYFSAADLVLLPYIAGTGSGIFSDAMAMKKPVIVSNIPYFKEFAKEYGCLKIVDNPHNFPSTIKEALKPKNYKKMIRECERYLKENGLTPISKKYTLFYKSLVNE